MNKYKLFGEDAELTYPGRLIMNEDVEKLEDLYKKGWDINKEAHFTDVISDTPLTLALVENKSKVLDFLLTKGVDLNQKGNPSIVNAVRNCSEDTIMKLVGHGAKAHLTNNVGSNAYSAALYSERYDLLDVILKSGLKVNADKGISFRQAVSDKQYEAVDFFIKNGIDVNQCVPDMVFPDNPTPVAVAASNDDFEMVVLLVEHGADVTVINKTGDRPYTHAVKNKNIKMQEYLKKLEPAKWHDEENRVKKLKKYKISQDLIAFLRGKNRRIDVPDFHIKYIVFHDIINAKEFTWKRRKLVDLASEVDQYSEEGFLVWSAKDRKIASVDLEHDEYRVLCSWQEFKSSPGKWLQRIFE